MSANFTRRTALKTFASGAVPLTLGAGAGAAIGTSLQSSDASSSGSDAGNTGSIQGSGPMPPLQTSWSVTLPELRAAPLVTSEHVLTMGVTDRTGYLYGLDRDSGTQQFAVSLDGPAVQSMLTTDGQRAFSASILEPRITAVSLDTETETWQTTVEELSQGFLGAPKVSDGTLYLRERVDHTVFAIDTETGDVERQLPGSYTRFSLDESRFYGARGSARLETNTLRILPLDSPNAYEDFETAGRPAQPTVGEETVYVGTSEGTVHAIDIESGSENWSSTVDLWPASFSLSDELLIGRTREYLVAFDRETGDERWRVEGELSRTVVADDIIYVAAEDVLRGFDVTTGEAEFLRRVPEIADEIDYVTVADDGAYLASFLGSVVKLEEIGSWTG